MKGFVLHPEARADLDEIWEYISADNIDAADRVVQEIYAAIQSLVRFPSSGHPRSDLTARPIRFQTVRDYVIAYASEREPLTIIAILHGRRNPRVIAALLRKRT